MKVLTFNLRTDFLLDINNRWNTRKKLVYDIINNNDYDIIGVQELNNKMYSDLSSEVSNYNIVGDPRSSRYFIERNDILVAKRHRILEHSTFWLSDKPDKMGSAVWYSVFPRICTTALVELEEGNLIRIYNTHLDFLLPKAREYGLKKIGEYIENKHKQDDYPAILMGDLNAGPKSKVVKEFTQGKYSSKRFVAVQDYNKEIYTRATLGKFKGVKTGLHIDYIFASDEFEIINNEIIYYNKNGRYPSDHYPMMAELKLKRC